MSKRTTVELHFISPIERNSFAAGEIHKAEVKNIRMGHTEADNSYWVRYEIEEE